MSASQFFSGNRSSSVAFLLTLLSIHAAAQTAKPPQFMGREVTLTEAETELAGYYPKGPATLCMTGRRYASATPRLTGLAFAPQLNSYR